MVRRLGKGETCKASNSPTDGLSSAEQALVIEMKPRQLDASTTSSRQFPRIAVGRLV
jgi:hypothetical protein